jgi:response regulator RpfG family c-di-GMP phosphodiesterase
MSARKEEKTNETIAVNEPKFNEKNTSKFSIDTTNFNERTYNALTQQQDVINMTFDNTVNNIKRSTDEATHEIPRYTQRIAEYFNQTYDVVYSIHSTPFNITK